MKMRNLYLLMLVLLVVFYACQSGEDTNIRKAEFGIHEIVKPNDIPLAVFNTLSATNIQFEKDTLMSVIGYISSNALSVPSAGPYQTLLPKVVI